MKNNTSHSTKETPSNPPPTSLDKGNGVPDPDLRIFHEPRFDELSPTCFEDQINFGYRGYGAAVTCNVFEINDLRMLTNYVLFLTSERTAKNFARVGRDLHQSQHRAFGQFLNLILELRQTPIPVLFNSISTSADLVAAILIDGACDYCNCRVDYLQVYDQVVDIAHQLQHFFYGHIDDIRFTR